MNAVDPASVLHYPDDVERHFVDAAQARAPRSTENECIDRLADAARDLSNLFTTERPASFPDYARRDDLGLAYGLLFFPQTWVRTRFALAEAIEARGWSPARRSISVLDLGAGLGAAGFAAAQLLVARRLADRARILAVDRSPAALDALAGPDGVTTRCPSSSFRIKVETRVADVREFVASLDATRGAFDLIVVSFALNELFASGPSGPSGPAGSDDAARAWLRDVASLLAPSGLLLVLEPALRETATRLRDLVRPLVEAGALHVLAPDLCGSIGPPPDDPRFFDHEVRRWRKPRSLARLNLRLRRSLDELTFSFLALSPTAPRPFPPSPRRARLTSPIARMKGRKAFTAIECRGEPPAAQARVTFDLLDRSLDADAKAALLSLERGDHVEVLDATPHREPGWWRIAGPEALRVAWTPRDGASGAPPGPR